MKRFFLLFPLFLLAVPLFGMPQPVHAQAATCASVSGVCRQSKCAETEIPSSVLKTLMSEPYYNEVFGFKAGEDFDCQPQGDTCCFPKEDRLCKSIGNRKKPATEGSAWGCLPASQKCQFPFQTSNDASKDLCPVNTVCCLYNLSTNAAVTMGSPLVVENPIQGISTVTGVIQRIIRVFLGMVGALAFAVFIYAGVTWMTAGSSDRVKMAKDSMKYAVIGITLIILSYAITNFIINAFANSGSFTSTPTKQSTQEAVPLGE
jgi:hypothetical protein